MATKQAVQTGGSVPQKDMVDTDKASVDERGDQKTEERPATENFNTESRMGELDKVRNILFGEQIRVYEDQMQQIEAGLKQNITAIGADLRERMEAMDERFKTQFDELFELIGKETNSRENQRDALASDLKQLTEAVTDFKKHQGEQLESLDKSLRSSLEERTQNLEQDLKAKMDVMAEEFKSSLDRLQVSALDRERFADLLTGLAREIAPQEKEKD